MTTQNIGFITHENPKAVRLGLKYHSRRRLLAGALIFSAIVAIIILFAVT